MPNVLELEKIFFITLSFVLCSYGKQACLRPLTTVTGTFAPSRFCSGDLIFEDDFNNLNQNVWLLENSMGIGGGSKEFQWYVNDLSNAYIDQGILHIEPTLTADIYGENFLYSGHVYIPPNKCTQDIFNGCNRTGDHDNIINPVRSIRMNTMKSFAFKYGVVEIRAKMPLGDWLFPALWLNPRFSAYGPWPMSGEIDLVESRGNPQLYSGNVNVGVEQISSTLHFGPAAGIDAWRTAHYSKNKQFYGYNEDFHVYRLIWTPAGFEFHVNNRLIGVTYANDGFFKRGKFDEDDKYSNPWINGTIMAPFDQEFYVIINLAVGGTSFFSDFYQNLPQEKPWLNKSKRPMADFWEGRDQWLNNWKLNKTDDAHFQIDYVRIWAL